MLELASRQKYSEQLAEAASRSKYRLAAQARLGIPEHYNRVYLANAPKLGVLSEGEARNVVRFYQLMDSLRADTSEGGRLYNGSIEQALFKSACTILDEALRTGKSLAVW